MCHNAETQSHSLKAYSDLLNAKPDYILTLPLEGITMETELITAFITASGAIFVAGASYLFTKMRERETELRKEKLSHYKDFVTSLSGIISGEYTADSQRAFALACNKLNLVAPQPVIRALQKFQEEIKTTNDTRSQDAHDRLMSELLYEMRKDLGVKPKDEKSSFTVGLWASGQPPPR